PLEKEIEFIQHFIELQKIRITDKVNIQLLVEGETEKKQIAPLILIPFVENAFKYGISTKEQTDIKFEVKCFEKSISFASTNTIVSVDKDPKDQNGIGLKNTRRRLELLYPGKHTLNVSQENNLFVI